jgi:hypothetical protein
MAFAEGPVGSRLAKVDLEKKVSSSERATLAVGDQHLAAGEEFLNRLLLGICLSNHG